MSTYHQFGGSVWYFCFFYYFWIPNSQYFSTIFKFFLQFFEKLGQFDIVFHEICYFWRSLVFLLLSAFFWHNWKNIHVKLVCKYSAGNEITLHIVKRPIMKLHPCIMSLMRNVFLSFGVLFFFLKNDIDIHIEWSKQFKWKLYFYASGQSGPFWVVLKLL